ncbi:hypothetical protein HQ576_07665 [bacterium]|nr:hypothetical protein [bacterium]
MNGARGHTVWLYDGVGQPWFRVDEVRGFLAEWLPWLAVGVRGDPLAGRGDEGPATRLCELRILHPTRERTPRRLLKPEVDVERRILDGTARPTPGVVYDGYALAALAGDRLPADETVQETIHVWLTERLIATWDDADRRYHARTIACGLPSIVSTAGMVQAPARDREFYLARRLGVSDARAAATAGADFLDHEDARTTAVAKGYAMQAVLYHLAGEPFCDDPHCRLFNAHWQREMLAAQLEGDDFCTRHRRMLDAWRAADTYTQEDTTP